MGILKHFWNLLYANKRWAVTFASLSLLGWLLIRRQISQDISEPGGIARLILDLLFGSLFGIILTSFIIDSFNKHPKKTLSYFKGIVVTVFFFASLLMLKLYSDNFQNFVTAIVIIGLLAWLLFSKNNSFQKKNRH